MTTDIKTTDTIKDQIESDLQSFEYCLDNKGAWSTPEGIKGLIDGMKQTQKTLRELLTAVTNTIDARTPRVYPPMATDNTANPVHNIPDDWDNTWQPAFDSDGAPTVEDLRAAMDAAALAYYQFGIETAQREKIAADAVYEKPANDLELNRKAKEAYFIRIDLDEKRAAFYKAFEAYYQFIFLRDYTFTPPEYKNIPSFNNSSVIEWRK